MPEDVVPTILSSPEATMLFVSDEEAAAGEEEGEGEGRGGGGEGERGGRASERKTSSSKSHSNSPPFRSRFPPPGPALGEARRLRAAEVAREWGGEEGEGEDWLCLETLAGGEEGEATSSSPSPSSLSSPSPSSLSSPSSSVAAEAALALGDGTSGAAAAAEAPSSPPPPPPPPPPLGYRLGRAADAAALAAASGARRFASTAARAASRAALVPRRVGVAARGALVSRYRLVGAQFFVCEDGVRGPVAPNSNGNESLGTSTLSSSSPSKPPLFSLPAPPPSLRREVNGLSSSSSSGSSSGSGSMTTATATATAMARSFVPLPNREAGFAPGEVDFDTSDAREISRKDSPAKVHRMAFHRARLSGMLFASIKELLPGGESASASEGKEEEVVASAAATASESESETSGSSSSKSPPPPPGFWRRRRERRQRQQEEQLLILQQTKKTKLPLSSLPPRPSVSLDARAVAPLPVPERAEALAPREALFPNSPSFSFPSSSVSFFSSAEEEVEVDVVVTGSSLWLVRCARLSLPDGVGASEEEEEEEEEEDEEEDGGEKTRKKPKREKKKRLKKKTSFAASVLAAPPLPVLLPPPTRRENVPMRLWAAVKGAAEAAVGAFARGGGDVLLVS